jgi:hypothetical protein
VFAWNNQYMDGRLRFGVLKRHDFIILKDNPGRYAAFYDLAENALAHTGISKNSFSDGATNWLCASSLTGILPF